MKGNLILDLVAGMSRDFPLQAQPAGSTTPWSDSNPSPFDGTETLAARVWPGAELPTLVSPTVTWIDHTAATFQVRFDDADTATVAPGKYEIQATASRGGRTGLILDGWLQLGKTTGTATARPTYCDIADLRKICGWVETLQADNDAEGFLDQCADAREWLDENILRNYTGGWASLMGYHDVALNSWFGGASRKSQSHNLFVEQQLADDHLIVSPRIRRVCALYALSLIFQANMTSGKDYLATAAMYRHQANQLLVGTTAEIDISGAGTTPNIPISFSAANVLFA